MVIKRLYIAALCTSLHLSQAFCPRPQAMQERQILLPSRELRASVDGDEGIRKAFIFGLGYTGLHLAKRLADQGWEVSGTVSSQDKAQYIEKETQGVRAFAFDASSGPLTDPQALASLRGSTHVVVTIAPMKDARGGDGVLRWHRDDLLTMPNLQWLGYLSSTGVYGDFQGAWVTEAETPQPNTPVGQARYQAEREWGALLPLPLHIFRLAGIYGPGRSAVDTLQKHGNDLAACGVTADDPAYISRIHLHDITQALEVAMGRTQAAARDEGVVVYNLADDRPASRFEVFSHARSLLTGEPAGVEAARPPSQGQEATPLKVPGSRRRQAGSKRVSNARLRSDLLAPAGLDLLYPDYMAGLQQVIQDRT